MRPETIGKVCELCGTPDDLQIHHISYDPEITQILCVSCHKKQHPGHGVGKSENSPMFDELRDEFIDLHLVMPNICSVAAKLEISLPTAHQWDKKTGCKAYMGRVCPDSVTYLQTPILQSVKDRLYELKNQHGHGSTGETIGWLIEELDEQQKSLGDLIEELDATKED